VKNVTTPPRISRETVDPRCEILKNLSSPVVPGDAWGLRVEVTEGD
jgi:hypothetical protein